MQQLFLLDGKAAEHRKRWLLAAAMALPALFQLALHGLHSLLPERHADAYGHVLAYAVSGLAALSTWALVARLEAARKDLQH